MNPFVSLMTHPQLREEVCSSFHHGTLCMISMTCKELLRYQDGQLSVILRSKNRTNGECIGTISMLEYTNLPISRKLTRAIVAGGSIDTLRYCFDKEVIKDIHLKPMAAARNNLEILKLCHQYRNPWSCIGIETENAVANGNMEILKYCLENGCTWSYRTLNYAADKGDLEMIKYCYENGCPLNTYPIECAAKKGYFDILRYCHENGFPHNKDAIKHAAEKGYIEIVQYCFENGFKLCGHATCLAAENGYFETFKYCYDNGIMYNRESEYIRIQYFAARNGNSDIIKFCYENNFPMDNSILTPQKALENGHAEIVRYCLDNGCPLKKKRESKPLCHNNTNINDFRNIL